MEAGVERDAKRDRHRAEPEGGQAMKEVLAACRRIWRRLGVRRTDARSMAAELEADLAAAENDGTSVGAYVGTDLRGFALEWARARGLVRTRLALVSTAFASILGLSL